MFLFRPLLVLLFVSALLGTATEGLCAEKSEQQNFNQQIAERQRQYQESLRQRAARISPAFQVKTESQIKQTVSKCSAKLQNGELDLSVALPRWKAANEFARFVAQHTPFSGLPSGTLGFGIGTFEAVLTISNFQNYAKSLAVSIADSVPKKSFALDLIRQGCNSLSYFTRIVRTIVLRN